MTTEQRIAQAIDLLCEFGKRVRELEKKVERLEKSTPPHLGKIERRSS